MFSFGASSSRIVQYAGYNTLATNSSTMQPKSSRLAFQFGRTPRRGISKPWPLWNYSLWSLGAVAGTLWRTSASAHRKESDDRRHLRALPVGSGEALKDETLKQSTLSVSAQLRLHGRRTTSTAPLSAFKVTVALLPYHLFPRGEVARASLARSVARSRDSPDVIQSNFFKLE